MDEDKNQCHAKKDVAKRGKTEEARTACWFGLCGQPSRGGTRGIHLYIGYPANSSRYICIFMINSPYFLKQNKVEFSQLPNVRTAQP